MPRKAILAVLLVGTAFGLLIGEPVRGQEHHGPMIVSPVNGATLNGPVTVSLGGDGGGGHHRHGGGHLVLLIDQPAPEPGSAVPSDQNHIAWQDGQTEATVTLAPGRHTLQLAMVDREGKIGRHAHATDPVSVVVQ